MKLKWKRIPIRPRHRFATAQGSVDEKEVILVTLEHDGIVGLGEVVASRLYGQTLESSEAALRGMTQILGDDPFRVEPIVQRASAEFDGQRAAISGLDSCLHDWVGKKLGTPVWRLLGLDRPRKRTTFTIGVATPAEIKVKLHEALQLGYDALKVKVGVAHDHETLSIIRKEFSGPLLVDANEAWNPQNAAQHMRELAPFKLQMIEQPLARPDSEHLPALKALRVAPLFIDESCQRPADVVRFHDAADGINIKFTKCGGIREALKMATLAEVYGLRTMLGCFVSSSLAIAPALAISSVVDMIDLDGHLLLANDPFTGIINRGSLLELSDAPGLGVRPADPSLLSMP